MERHMRNQNPADVNISFEFFPPKTPEGSLHLQNTAERLAALAPKYFSVTYGAGGSTQERTFETVINIQNQTTINTAPHISCISSKAEKIRELLQAYKANGIRNIVALRGDLPPGTMTHAGEFRYARDLVAFIREEMGSYFHIEVAAYPEFHPETPCTFSSLKHFHEKIIAGADSVITQYFYNADAYFYFRDACDKLNIKVPIVPGIMPITNYKQLARFSDLCGAEIPRWLRLRLESCGEDLAAISKFGEEVISQLCEKLLQGGASGLHFYTLNKAEPSLTILANLNLTLDQLVTVN